jgi:beta-lactamase regulating signal transducer with metallopeptidase domain
LTQTLAENSLLQRLCFATLEFAVLALVLALALRWVRFSSQRLVACLWLIVLAKPLVTLAVGSPIVLLEIQAPARASAQHAAVLDVGLPALPPQSGAALDVRPTPSSAPSGGLTDLSREFDAVGPAPASAATESAPLRVETVLLAIWGAGVAYCALRYLRLRRQLAHMARRAVLPPEPFRRAYAAIARELRPARFPALRVIDDIDTPALVGLVRPTILLPRRLVENSSAAATEWALRHELAHWRWRDPFAILVRDFVSVCFFFHPLLPWVVRRHAEAMEMACDWESLRDPSDAAEYAEGLCGILLLMQDRPPQRAIESSLAMATHGRMVRRMRALLEGERALPLTSRSAVGVLFVALSVFALGCTVERNRGPGNDSATAASPTPTPSPAPKPAAPDKPAAPAGGREDVARGVLQGLRWLVRHQNPDGSWSPTTIAQLCPCENPMYKPKEAYTKRFDEGLTGLALLCFLGAGFTNESPQDVVDTTTGKRYRLGDIVGGGLRWLKNRQKPDGSFCTDRPYMYSEAMAGMALAEAYGLTQSSEWKEPAQRSMNFIQAAQRPSPKGEGFWGWRYASRQEIEKFARGGALSEEIKKELYDADSSITGWCTMALRAGQAAGLDIGKDHLEGALAFTKAMTAENGMVGYLSARGAGATVSGPGDHYTYHPAVMSALGVCTRLYVEHDADDPFFDLAAKQIVKDMPAISPDKLSIDYYYWYYGSLALNQIDGPNAPDKTNKYWGPWSQGVVDAVLATQDKQEKSCTNGGWMVPDRWSRDGGPIYTTALNVLTLEVYDRKIAGGAGASRK